MRWWLLAQRTSRGSLFVVGVVLALSISALVVATATGSWDAAPTASGKAVIVDGKPAVGVTVTMDVADADLPAMITLEVERAHIGGLSRCAPVSLDEISIPGPVPPEFTCVTTRSFTAASLAALERLGHVTEVWGVDHHHRGSNLYFLGVHRGQPAIIVQTPTRKVRRDLAALRELPESFIAGGCRACMASRAPSPARQRRTTRH